MDFLSQQYNIESPEAISPQVDAMLPYHVSNSVSTGNQVLEHHFPYGDAISDGPYYHQYDDQQVVFTYHPMMTPPCDANQTQFIDFETCGDIGDMKPIMRPGFEHSHIFNAPKLSDDHLYANLENSGIERPDLKIMIPAEDVKPYIIKSQSPPTPPTSPPTSTTSNDLLRLKKITSINVDEDVKIVKHENENSNLNDQDQNELPTFVNPKQYERILKRRAARERFQKKHNIPKERKPYIHQSRHNHAVRRLRGPGGRFLSAAETAAATRGEMDRRQSLNSNASSCVSPTSLSPSSLSPTTPVSQSTFFNVPVDYPCNEHYQVEGYLIENNDSWAPELCKNDNFPNMMTTGNVIDSYASNVYENFSQPPLQLQQTQTHPVIYHLSPNNNQIQYLY